ncbi:DNA polymerase IV [Candidatus Saganbacteria bacterium]|nr:DNA polymerase IV [Candidatus Saganbacteria bacterium]
MNAYFASVEQASNPFLRGKPIAVGGGTGGKRTIVAACSYEAKARGIKNAMTAWDARKICPDLIMVSGNMDKYIYTSSEIIKIFREYTDRVEVFSIDECFLDVTDTEERFGGAVQIARQIKQKIRERFHLTCSIGISFNKLLAKLAGELKKPDGLMTIRPEDIPEKLKDIEVSKLCGVGRKLEKYLGELGVKTFGDLNRYPREKLVKRFGMACGEGLYCMGQGKDNSQVSSNYDEEAKSMGHSYTLPKATDDIDEVKGYLLRLSEQVGRRLRRDHYKGNVVHLSLGFEDFNFWGKQKKIEDHLDDGYEIYKIAERILGAFRDRRARFRFVGVSVSNLTHNLDQISLFEKNERKKKILKAVDEINDRYGEFVIERLAILDTVLHGKVGMVDSRTYNVI